MKLVFVRSGLENTTFPSIRPVYHMILISLIFFSPKSDKRKTYDTPPREDDEERRKFLRDVEVKVMRFVDKLEQRGGSKSGLNIQKEAQKFRQQLIDVRSKFSSVCC